MYYLGEVGGLQKKNDAIGITDNNYYFCVYYRNLGTPTTNAKKNNYEEIVFNSY